MMYSSRLKTYWFASYFGILFAIQRLANAGLYLDESAYGEKSMHFDICLEWQTQGRTYLSGKIRGHSSTDHLPEDHAD